MKTEDMGNRATWYKAFKEWEKRRGLKLYPDRKYGSLVGRKRDGSKVDVTFSKE